MSLLVRCPACATLYRVTPRHLEIAAGHVTCGECDYVFDARGRVTEAPRAGTLRAAELSGVPAILQEDVLRLSRRGAAPLPAWWRVIALVAAAGLVAQILWQSRAWWYPASPRLATFAVALCARMGCDDDLPRRPGLFVIDAREIRTHPEHPGALLVKVVFVNRAATVADYPVIDLRLDDLAGNVVGQRRFEPAEYLEQGQPMWAGIAPGATTSLVLELVEPAGTAENFEITFL